MRKEDWFYVGIIGLMIYYIYVVNQPKLMSCEQFKPGVQECIIINNLGNVRR